MANVYYNSAKRDVMNGSIDLDTDTLKVLLVTSTYAPNIDTHAKLSDITNEVTGTGYTAGGATLANKTVTANTTSDRGVFDADDASWATATITARAAVIYKSRGGVATADELLCYIDFVTDKTSTAGTFLIQWHADGILYHG